jgi:hypothetical protein
MKTNLRDKLRRELGSFYALAIMNIVFGGIAMALGIDFGVKNVLVLTEVKTCYCLNLLLL